MKKFESLLIKDVLSKDICNYLTSYLMFSHNELKLGNPDNPLGDQQVPGAFNTGHNFVFDVANELVWPLLEQVVEEELIPTYSYARLYFNGNTLEPHTDRPSCEVSLTVQLGRSHHYSWPIYVKDKRYDLAEGDGVLYAGCDAEHWRKKCKGPDGYYSGQVFLHYVRKNGPYAEFAGDKRWGGQIPHVRHSCFEMYRK